MTPARLSDAQWLARRGFRLGAGGYLEELAPSPAADWLAAFLSARGGSAPYGDVRAAAIAAGWRSTSTLKRARVLAGVVVMRRGNRGGFTVWALPATAAATAPPARAAVAATPQAARAVAAPGRHTAAVA